MMSTATPVGGAIESPRQMLERLARERATGELVVADGGGEQHVYLQEGRVAWATSSQARYAFTRYLVDVCGVDRDVMRDVVSECQRTRQPIGETLVQWKLVGPEQVRDALLSQVRETLAELGRAESARGLFLPRSGAYKAYDSSLTFSLEDATPPAVAPTPAETIPTLVPASEAEDAIVTRIVDALGDAAQWAMLQRADRVVAKRGGALNPPVGPVPASLAGELGDGHGDLVVVRNGAGTLFGWPIAALRASAWCAVPSGMGVGLAMRLLGGALRVGFEKRGEPRRPYFGLEVDCGGLPHSLCAPLRAAAEQTDELLAALVFSPDAAVTPAVVRRSGFDVQRALQTATTAMTVAEQTASTMLPTVDVAAADGAYDMTSLQLGQNDEWHFGALLATDTGLRLWLVFERQLSSGFGWALLTSLSRQVGDAAVLAARPA